MMIVPKKIRTKGSKIADSLSIADFVVKIGEELPRKTGDPLETDLEKARMWKIPIIETSRLDGNCEITENNFTNGYVVSWEDN